MKRKCPICSKRVPSRYISAHKKFHALKLNKQILKTYELPQSGQR